jgi:hypothetical protein
MVWGAAATRNTETGAPRWARRASGPDRITGCAGAAQDMCAAGGISPGYALPLPSEPLATPSDIPRDQFGIVALAEW